MRLLLPVACEPDLQLRILRQFRVVTQVLQRLVHLGNGTLEISALGETGGPDIEGPGVSRPLLLAQYFSDPFRFDAISPSRIWTGAQKPGQFRGDSPVARDFLIGSTK